MTMEWTTQDLASFGGDNSDPDLLDLRAGMPMGIYDAQEIRGGSAGTRARYLAMTEAELRDHLVNVRGLDLSAAAPLAHALRSPMARNLLAREWYTKEVSIDFSQADGVELSGSAINYQQVRIERDVARVA